jgi:hypothetical protein
MHALLVPSVHQIRKCRCNAINARYVRRVYNLFLALKREVQSGTFTRHLAQNAENTQAVIDLLIDIHQTLDQSRCQRNIAEWTEIQTLFLQHYGRRSGTGI